MDVQAFHAAYNESRNGANQFFRHPLVRFFVYSDGVQECAEAGCYWLLDIIGTEIAPKIRKGVVGNVQSDVYHSGWVVVNVKDNKATITLEIVEGKPIYTRDVEYTDMPAGKYEFEIGFDGEHVILCLISEH